MSQEKSTHGSAIAPVQASVGKVLVVDDEAHMQQVLAKTLRFQGHQVEVAGDGCEALEKVASMQPDAVVLDVMMPGLNGFEVCRRIKREAATRAVQVLILTGLNDRQNRLKGIRCGADDLLTKPFDAEEIALRVSNAVRTKQLFDENIAHKLELEERVWERTRELSLAHARLQMQFGELEGRDRLVRFQMQGPSVEEARQEAVKVVGEVLGAEQVVFYEPDGDYLRPVAALGGVGETLPALEQQGDEDATAVVAYRTGRLQRSESGSVAAPIVGAEEVLGVLWVDSLQGVGQLGVFWRLAGEISLLMRAAALMDELERGQLDLSRLI